MIYSDIIFNGITFSRFARGSGYQAEVIQGDQVGIRDTIDAIPGVDGVERYKSFYGDRLIEIKGFVKGTSESDLYTKINALIAGFDINALQTTSVVADANGFAPLTFTDPGQGEAYFKVKPIKSTLAISEQRTGLSRGFALLLEAKDPKKYASTNVTLTLTPSSGGSSSVLPFSLPIVLGGDAYSATASLNYTGSTPAYPTSIKLYGPCTAPSITNITTGNKLEFTGSVVLLANEYVEISPDLSTCVKHDVSAVETNVASYLTTDSEYWQVIPGINNTQFTASSLSSGAQAIITVEVTV